MDVLIIPLVVLLALVPVGFVLAARGRKENKNYLGKLVSFYTIFLLVYLLSYVVTFSLGSTFTHKGN